MLGTAPDPGSALQEDQCMKRYLMPVVLVVALFSMGKACDEDEERNSPLSEEDAGDDETPLSDELLPMEGD